MITEIVVAAMHGDSVRVRDLHALGYSVDAVDERGWMPIHWAAGHGSFEGARGLVDCGVEPSSTTSDGKTASQIAEQFGHHELAGWLSYARPPVAIADLDPPVARRRISAMA